MKQIEELIKRLETIAKDNGDSFEYALQIEPGRSGILYRFVCSEQADVHTFVEGSGATILDAVRQASESIQASCGAWGYE